MNKRIDVALSELDVKVFEDDRLVRHITDCAVGRAGHHTPMINNGALSMTKRDRNHHSSLYNGASMPWALFFEQDPTCAFHEGPTAVASHGCIHLNAHDAEWLFNWAGHDHVHLQISGPYPDSPIRKGGSQPTPGNPAKGS